ncbi:hypothetical protein J1605_012589 [Eschrichtius robustus]|uniref:Carbohydrate kinase FGGY C-terminal domain-containing protein n=1 Tax=Eschrichtius robustus TaxID=9764 RepID=A0AB34GLU5_ESCRO|nr:hypothetical protein J1605_012589 [Eschrichtius robustus]
MLTASTRFYPTFPTLYNHWSSVPIANTLTVPTACCRRSFIAVTGLKLSQDLDDLAILYLATVQAIAFGTRLIIEAMESAGHSISTLFLCGGLGKNPLFVQMHADITGMPVVLSQEVESVLVGAAILGACASGDFASVQDTAERGPSASREGSPHQSSHAGTLIFVPPEL